jgi:hypothetical protein
MNQRILCDPSDLYVSSNFTPEGTLKSVADYYSFAPFAFSAVNNKIQ